MNGGDFEGADMVSIFARRDQVGFLMTLTMGMDVRMCGKPRRFLGARIMVDYACRDAGVAAEFLKRWDDYCGDTILRGDLDREDLG